MREGVTMRFEIRDGRERRAGSWDAFDDSVVGTTESGMFSRLQNKGKKRSAISLDWFAGRSRAGTDAAAPPVPPTKVQPARTESPHSF